MIESWRKSIYDMVCSKRGQANFEEFGFFTDKFKPLEARDHQIVEQHKKTATYSAVGGACLGFSLTLAFRRYMPKYRYSMSFLRVATEFGFVSGMMMYSVWNFGIPKFIVQMKDFREELVLKNDYQYLLFLKHKYRQFPELYSREILVFKDFMPEASFVKWYSDHPQYSFEAGQVPLENDFSSKEVYKNLMVAVNSWSHRQQQPEASKPASK